jgi:FlaA1/EpsC-like NDP-sugar epimerase
MDRAENSLFEIDRHLAAAHPHLPRRPMLHDVVNAESTRRRVVELRPHAVFHAAAHKHVPLMQDHPAEALTNNLFGTRSVADAALAAGAERFVFVSTDKAVRPTSVMGATKQLAERYIRAQNQHQRTRFALVRFGNVLGSAASVLPIWASQIAEGGPITITDPEMTRYFMTIPEAATLVCHAAAIATTSSANPDLDPADVFVLDMGEPVSIVELARRFAASLGLTALMDHELADADARRAPLGPAVGIRVTGARPGEKLHEQLAHEHSQLEQTSVPGVFCWRGASPRLADATQLIRRFEPLRDAADAGRVLDAIACAVPDAEGFARARSAA